MFTVSVLMSALARAVQDHAEYALWVRERLVYWVEDVRRYLAPASVCVLTEVSRDFVDRFQRSLIRVVTYAVITSTEVVEANYVIPQCSYRFNACRRYKLQRYGPTIYSSDFYLVVHNFIV